MKNKLFKRIVSTALCATMAAGLLAGCGSAPTSNASGEGGVKR